MESRPIRFAGGVEAPERSAQHLDESAKGNWLVTVFDNDHNTYAEVMTILMIATSCSPDEAHIETWEIDHLGLCVVHRAAEKECHKVANIISTIGIKVTVSEDS